MFNKYALFGLSGAVILGALTGIIASFLRPSLLPPSLMAWGWEPLVCALAALSGGSLGLYVGTNYLGARQEKKHPFLEFCLAVLSALCALDLALASKGFIVTSYIVAFGLVTFVPMSIVYLARLLPFANQNDAAEARAIQTMIKDAKEDYGLSRQKCKRRMVNMMIEAFAREVHGLCKSQSQARAVRVYRLPIQAIKTLDELGRNYPSPPT